MSEKIYCIGMGVVTSNAENCKEFAELIRSGSSNIGKVHSFDCGSYNCKYAAEIDTLDYSSKFLTMAEKACDEAVKDAGIEPSSDLNVSLVIGTSLGNMPALESTFKGTGNANPSGIASLQVGLMNYLCDMLADKLKINGISTTISNTCVSAINAVAFAYQLISSGQTDICIVGGVETVSEMIFAGLTADGLHYGRVSPWYLASDQLLFHSNSFSYQHRAEQMKGNMRNLSPFLVFVWCLNL